MRKRLLACVLALAMATTLLPMSVFAVDGLETDKPTQTNPLISTEEVTSVSSNTEGAATTVGGPVKIEKSVADNTISLSAYVTGEVKKSSTPLDIVLVLDVSGSMGDPYSGLQYSGVTKAWTYNEVKGGEYYYRFSDGEYVKVEGATWRGQYYLYASEPGFWGDSWESSSSWNPNATLYNGTLYTKTEYTGDSITKMKALQSAVNEFIESVNADATANKVTHNISIVKFAGDKTDKIGNDKYQEKGVFDKPYGDYYNNTQIVVALTDVVQGKQALLNAVNSLTPTGATRADFGMQKAADALKNSGSERQKVVIMFTDGVPTKKSTFNNEVASAAINAARTLKSAGTQVFTVGIFDEAPGNEMTNYMNAVSSNYPNATYNYIEQPGPGHGPGSGGGHGDNWQWNLGTPAESTIYYKDATNLDLSAVFQQIQSEMATVKVESTAVLSDTLSDCFKLPDNAGQNIKAEVQSISKDGQNWTSDTNQPTLEVKTDGKTVSVTGFEYGANPVINKGTAEVPNWTGKRVVLTIPFEPDTNYTGWAAGEKNYFTNDTDTKKAGLRDGKEIYNELTKSPTAPVTGYTVTYEWNGLPTNVTASPSKPAQTVLIPGQTFTKDTNNSYTAEGYTFEGWGDPKYGTDQTLQPTTDDTYTMPANNVTITGTWTPNAPTTGTLTIAKTINWAGSEEETTAVREAANGHTFTFQVMKGDEVVDTVDITYSKDFASGEEMKVNSKSIQVAFGDYTVVEVASTIDLTDENVTYTGKADYPFGKDVTITAGNTAENPAICLVTNIYEKTDSETETVTIPFTKVVKQGGNAAPGKQSFELELIQTDTEVASKLTVNATIDTTGVGTYNGTMTISGPEELVESFISNDFFVREKNTGATYWTYDDTVWLVRYEAATAYSAGEAANGNGDFVIYYTVLEPEGDESHYVMDESKAPASRMTFTNTYTRNTGGGGGGGHSRPTLNTEDHYGYVIGYPDGTVQPGGSITRAEVATIFFRMLTDSSRTEFWSQTNSFSDVPSTAWYNNAVSTLTKAGIIAGYEDGTFQPNATITRAEFATIAVRFFEASYDGKDFFTDIDGHWAQKYINDAANAGLVNGYEDGTFGPNKAITRAEAMTLVNRALDRHPDADHFLKDMITWPDNSDTTAWYYEDVQEATNSHEYTMKTNTDKTKYEVWTKMLEMRDWKAFEAAWSNANSASNPGEVMGK